MTIKVKVIEENKEADYPKLIQDRYGNIFLATGEYSGTKLYAPDKLSENPIGTYREDWLFKLFKTEGFHGKLILEN